MLYNKLWQVVKMGHFSPTVWQIPIWWTDLYSSLRRCHVCTPKWRRITPNTLHWRDTEQKIQQVLIPSLTAMRHFQVENTWNVFCVQSNQKCLCFIKKRFEIPYWNSLFAMLTRYNCLVQLYRWPSFINLQETFSV